MTVMEAITTRRSVRSYDSRAIAPEIVERLCEALRLAPSACNIQPWRFVLVTESDMKKKLAIAAKEQMFIAEAPLVVVGCGFPKQAYPRMGGYGNSVDIDLAIALDHLTLAAAAEGLGTCWIGAFHEDEVKKLLDVPEDVKVVAMMPVGYPKSEDVGCLEPRSERKAPEEIFAHERFEDAAP